MPRTATATTTVGGTVGAAPRRRLIVHEDNDDDNDDDNDNNEDEDEDDDYSTKSNKRAKKTAPSNALKPRNRYPDTTAKPTKKKPATATTTAPSFEEETIAEEEAIAEVSYPRLDANRVFDLRPPPPSAVPVVAPPLSSSYYSSSSQSSTTGGFSSQERRDAADLSRFQSLLKPIRNLALNWDVDIANELEEYVHEVARITYSLDNIHGLNFAEAALLIQGSACVYSKKVEYLYTLVFQTLELISDKASKGKQKLSVNEDGEDEDAVVGNKEIEFLTLDDIQECSNIDLVEDLTAHSKSSKRPDTLLPQTPIAFMPQLDKTLSGGTDLISNQGEIIGKRQDFKMNTAIIHPSGALLLDTAALKLQLQYSNDAVPSSASYASDNDDDDEDMGGDNYPGDDSGGQGSFDTGGNADDGSGGNANDGLQGPEAGLAEAGNDIPKGAADATRTPTPDVRRKSQNPQQQQQQNSRLLSLGSEDLDAISLQPLNESLTADIIDPWLMLDPHEPSNPSLIKPFRKGKSYRIPKLLPSFSRMGGDDENGQDAPKQRVLCDVRQFLIRAYLSQKNINRPLTRASQKPASSLAEFDYLVVEYNRKQSKLGKASALNAPPNGQGNSRSSWELGSILGGSNGNNSNSNHSNSKRSSKVREQADCVDNNNSDGEDDNDDEDYDDDGNGNVDVGGEPFDNAEPEILGQPIQADDNAAWQSSSSSGVLEAEQVLSTENDDQMAGRSVPDDDSLPQQQQTLESYEDACRQQIEQYFAKAQQYDMLLETALSQRVREWERRLTPILEEQEKVRFFDVHAYESDLLQRFKQLDVSIGHSIGIDALVEARTSRKQENIRFFMAALHLANSNNVEIVPTESQMILKLKAWNLR